ncbi:hypothetical protein Godav_028643, partial [Gossypium davidsonii]|nr:hypothetical protein [Gossypium davidsonii]
MAFEDAFQLTFPVGAGAMNVVACQLLQVMEQCVARLDVAMFYAILWESENEVPTDPISNPIVDSKRKAYTSDEELNSPLTSTIEKLLLSPTIVAKGSMNGEHKLDGYGGLIALYKLLREVWLMLVLVFSPSYNASCNLRHSWLLDVATILKTLYMHTSMHWTQDNHVMIAKNAFSGLDLIVKCCSNDVWRHAN